MKCMPDRQMHDLFIANHLCWSHGVHGDYLYNICIKFERVSDNIIVSDSSVKKLHNVIQCFHIVVLVWGCNLQT